MLDFPQDRGLLPRIILRVVANGSETQLVYMPVPQVRVPDLPEVAGQQSIAAIRPAGGDDPRNRVIDERPLLLRFADRLHVFLAHVVAQEGKLGGEKPDLALVDREHRAEDEKDVAREFPAGHNPGRLLVEGGIVEGRAPAEGRVRHEVQEVAVVLEKVAVDAPHPVRHGSPVLLDVLFDELVVRLLAAAQDIALEDPQQAPLGR